MKSKLEKEFELYKPDIDRWANSYKEYDDVLDVGDIRSELYLLFIDAFEKYDAKKAKISKISFRNYLSKCAYIFMRSYYVPYLNKFRGLYSLDNFLNTEEREKREREKENSA